MKKMMIVILCVTLSIPLGFSAPVKSCEFESERIADDMDEEKYYECSADLIPLLVMCKVGFFFDIIERVCKLVTGSDGSTTQVCKTPRGMVYGCYNGNALSFRPRCPNGTCN